MLVLDSGGLSHLAKRDQQTVAFIIALRRRGLWPPTVPAVVLVESLTGAPQRDSNVNRLLKVCELRTALGERLARRAAVLRTAAGRGSAVDALVVAIAEPGSVVLTSDRHDLAALAEQADGVVVEAV